MSIDKSLRRKNTLERARIEQVLERTLSLPEAGSARLRDAMRYSVLGAGKRLRPTLVYLTGEALGAPLAQLDAPAAAVELIHVYSLVHDDLPAMDDDDLRRGRPTCHRAYDEATAILVGDALQALAFAVLAKEPLTGVSAPSRLEMIRVLARATGTSGMAGGQAVDLDAVGRTLTVSAIEDMHRRLPDTTKLRALIGWAPERDLEHILEQTIAAATREAGANPVLRA